MGRSSSYPAGITKLEGSTTYPWKSWHWISRSSSVDQHPLGLKGLEIIDSTDLHLWILMFWGFVWKIIIV